MPTIGKAAAAALLIASLLPASADARPLHRHKAHVAHRARGPVYAQPYGYRGAPGYGPSSAFVYPDEDPYNPYAIPGAALRALARRNQHAPGVTNELAPDNIATATGGPSGGVPGFSGR